MRRLTFKGYLRWYARSLSSCDSNDIFRLAKEAEHNHRLREPLFLYACSLGKVSALLRATKSEALREKYYLAKESFSFEEIISMLEKNDTRLDERYHKVYKSFLVKRNMPETDSSYKTLILNRINKLKSEKNVSNYQIYTRLNLNHGNVNSFLKNGEVGKVSVAVAEKILSYVEAC